MPSVLAAFDRLLFYASDYRDINFARSHRLSRLTVLSNGASEVEFNVPRDRGFRRRHGIPDEAFLVMTVGTFTGGLKGHRELALAFEAAAFGDRAAVLLLNGNVMSVAPALAPFRAAMLPSVARRLRRLPGAARRRGRLIANRLLRRAHAGSRSVQPSIPEIVARINRGRTSKQATITDLPRPELVQAYLNSNLFVFASNVEYSPLVLFEAAAAGLPVLTVPVGNAAEIVSWTGGGVVCPAPQDALGYTRVDPSVLAVHLTQLSADPEGLASLGAHARLEWSKRFTWAIVADRYEALFRELVAEHRTVDVAG
jgi:glycosyltransferase involved in cell wall biosynthesis